MLFEEAIEVEANEVVLEAVDETRFAAAANNVVNQRC